MATENLEYKLVELTNETDIKVKFDPTFLKTTVAKQWVPSDKTEEGAPQVSAPSPIEEKTRIDGILVPIVKINSIVVPNQDILQMRLDYTEFRPVLYLQVRKTVFSKLETPGMVSKVTVIMIPPVDKTYRKISIDFYIDDISDLGSKIAYSCSMFFPDLEKKWTRSIKYEGNNKLNTFNLCKSIATECGLGFATTNQCEEIADTKIRLMRSQSFENFIQEHVGFGGIDNNSYFMTWIDVYGYLVLCNVAWVLNKATNVNELSMHMLEGLNVTNESGENSIKYGEKTFRTFTNWKSGAKHQANYINEYKWIVDNTEIKSFGTNNTYYTINHKVTGGNNDIVTETVTIEDKSADGQNYKNAYDFQDIKFLGVEMASKDDGNTPILYQKQRRNAYIKQIMAKKLKVVLNDLNINLERGTLVNIQIFEFEKDIKAQMLNLSDNLSKTGNTNSYPSSEIENKQDILDNPQIGIPNLSISGIYFIDGIEYVYRAGQEKIVQTLYLIKQTPSNNYLNMSSLPKLSPEE